MSAHRLSSALALASAAALAALAAAGPAAATTPRAATTPAQQLLKTAAKDALLKGSVHSVTKASFGTVKTGSVSDAGADSGVQVNTASNGATGDVRVLGKTSYFDGNVKELRDNYGFSAKTVATIGKRWVSAKYPTNAFEETALDVTLPLTVVTIVPSGTLTELPATTMDGQSVTPIRGTIPSYLGLKGTMTVYVSATAHPLPVEVVDAYAKGTGTTIFSRWGEKVSVHAPSDSIALTTLAKKS